MGVITKCIDKTVRASLDGEIDHHTARAIRMEIDSEISAVKAQKLILDFGGVTFMDSSAVGLIMGRFKLLSSWGGTVQIENLSERNYKMMSLAGMDKLCTLKRSEDR